MTWIAFLRCPAPLGAAQCSKPACYHRGPKVAAHGEHVNRSELPARRATAPPLDLDWVRARFPALGPAGRLWTTPAARQRWAPWWSGLLTTCAIGPCSWAQATICRSKPARSRPRPGARWRPVRQRRRARAGTGPGRDRPLQHLRCSPGWPARSRPVCCRATRLSSARRITRQISALAAPAARGVQHALVAHPPGQHAP
jgi:hypothetical protein